LVSSGLIIIVCGQVELLGKKIKEMTTAANTAVLVNSVSLSMQVAAVSEITKELNAEVEQLQMLISRC